MTPKIRKTPAAPRDTDSAITFRGGAFPGARYASGNVILDEQFRDGRLTTRYWNPHGQVWPEMHLERKVGGHVLDGDLDTQLRLCLCRIIFRGIAPSVDELTPYLRGRIEHYLDLYRQHIRPIMIDGLVYHHTPFLRLAEPTPWCVLEYGRPDRTTAVAGIFRTSATAAGTSPDDYLLRPRGLDPALEYEVALDNGGSKFRCPGEALGRDGIRIRLEQPQTSELVLFTQARGKR